MKQSEIEAARLIFIAQLKDERANLPMNKEWDRCYQAIEMVIQNTYLGIEKEQHGQTWDKSLDNLKARGMNEMRAYCDFDDYYQETYKQD